MHRHGQQAWLRYGLTALATVFLSVALFLGYVFFLLFLMDHGFHWLIFLPLLPVVVYLILIVGRLCDDAFNCQDVDLSKPMVHWMPCDPMHQRFGLWRAEIESYPAEIDSFKSRRMVKKYVRRLVEDWSIRSAWSCEVLSVSQANSRMAKSSGTLFLLFPALDLA
jgi:hypothetical protein